MKMKIKIFFFTIIGLLLFSNSFSQQIQLDSLDLQIHQLIKDFDIPGLSIGIVRNDSIIFSKGYGNLEIHKERKVDENTIFGIGSISKSFTALTLGILVDEGKINWDDKVKDYLPYFELYSPYVTDNFTIRDLLTHRSGLKDVSGGALWYHSDYPREENNKATQIFRTSIRLSRKAGISKCDVCCCFRNSERSFRNVVG